MIFPELHFSVYKGKVCEKTRTFTYISHSELEEKITFIFG